jgi:hypothetical protein
VEGQDNKATGYTSHAEGLQTEADGVASHAEGEGSFAGGTYAHAEGNGTVATGESSHAEGAFGVATALGSHAEGAGCAFAEFAHGEGDVAMAMGDSSHAEGIATQAWDFASHSEGYFTVATSWAAHAEGVITIAGATGAHSQGIQTNALGLASGSYGKYSLASQDGQESHAYGRFNGVTGSAQYSRYHLMHFSTSGPTGLPQTLTIEDAPVGPTTIPAIPDNTLWKVRADVVGHDSSNTFQSVFTVENGLSRIEPTGVVLTGATTTSSWISTGGPVTLAADNVNKGLLVQVIPVGPGIIWYATVTISSVTW